MWKSTPWNSENVWGKCTDTLQELGTGKYFPNETLDIQKIMPVIDKWDFIKLKKLLHSKETIKWRYIPNNQRKSLLTIQQMNDYYAEPTETGQWCGQ